ncbi:MAG: ribose 5-phosphate isomerase B [Chitinophagales bacterium]|nr:ribose 5-phosphate isomerase B [Chitinophagales bacterium]MCZ2393743.1 ribose 5-phosphate isomerase B [Chitinophagales bacterium]
MQFPKTIAIGADHAGFEFKSSLILYLQELNIEVTDFGTYSKDSVDYPDYVHPACKYIEDGHCEFGILICGSANGVAMTANKHQKIRAALCWDNEISLLARQHNDANIVCIPARFITLEHAKEIVNTFLSTDFEGGRHQNRVNKIACC